METIQVRFLADFLNEMLATERAVATLYRAAIARSEDPDLRRRLKEFQGDTLLHETVVTDLIADLQGEPGPASAGIQVVLASLISEMASPAEPELRQWKDLETILGAELLCQRNWQVLGAIGECNQDPHIQKAYRKAVHEEDKHVEHLRAMVLAMAPQAVLSA